MKKFIFALSVLCASGTALAQVKVEDAWVRGTAPMQEATGAFMKLSSPTDTRLVDVASPVGRAEIHEMSMQDNVMRMKQIEGLDLPAGKAVELKPGSYHLMLTGLKNQLKEGDTVPITLIFKNKEGKRESVEAKVPVRALTARQPAAPASHSNSHSGH